MVTRHQPKSNFLVVYWQDKFSENRVPPVTNAVNWQPTRRVEGAVRSIIIESMKLDKMHYIDQLLIQKRYVVK